MYMVQCKDCDLVIVIIKYNNMMYLNYKIKNRMIKNDIKRNECFTGNN